MTNEELIIHLTRKVAELEQKLVKEKEDTDKYREWWLNAHAERDKAGAEITKMEERMSYMLNGQQAVDFACNVYDHHYTNEDASFRTIAEKFASPMLDYDKQNQPC